MKRLILLAMICVLPLMVNAQDIATHESDSVVSAVVDSLNTPVVQNVVVVEKTVKFGYLSYSTVMKQMDEYAETMKTIEQLRVAYEAELKRSEDNFSKLFAEYIEGQRTFPDNILLKRQKELQQAMDESIKFKNEARGILEAKEKEVMDRLRRQINDAIRKLAQDRHYAFIINTDGDTYPFVNPEMGDNVTEDVIRMLK